MTLLEFTLRNEFGRDRYFPSNQASRCIVDITGRKCLKDVEVERLRHSGFDILIKKQPEMAREDV